MQKTSSTPVSFNDSALRGATLAFRSSPSPSNRNPLVTSSGGAATAASRAGTKHASTWRNQVPTTTSISINPGNGLTQAERASQRNALILGSPEDAETREIKRRVSPSHIAATRAASRSSTLSKQDGGLKERFQQSKPPVQIQASRDATDESPIPPTSRLVELFEAKQRADRASPVAQRQDRVVPANDNILSPTPTRPSISIRLRAPSVSTTLVPDPSKPTSPLEKTLQKPKVMLKKRPSSHIQSARPSSIVNTKPVAETRPQPIPSTQQTLAQDTTGIMEAMPAPQTMAKPQTIPLPPPPRRQSVKSSSSQSVPQQTRPASVGPLHEKSKFSSQPVSIPPAPPRRISHLQFDSLKPQMSVDSLANAMVASSLASSRASSPAHSYRPDPLFPQHSGKAYSISSFLLLHSPTHTPSQHKVLPKPSRSPHLRQTLRRTTSSSDEQSSKKHGKHPHKNALLLKKHPNKHAEGTRRHWRDSITERERKRYEGLWAANRGLLMQHEQAHNPTTIQDSMHNLVVREIWSRSGLSTRTLHQIWDLVESSSSSNSAPRQPHTDTPRQAFLTKHEFVVGLWLVDQSLKGRKLPAHVQESVWDSARELMSGLRAR